MQTIYQDPYRPILAFHVEARLISLVFLTGARILWFGTLALDTADENTDWGELNRICAYYFPKVERILIDTRPFAFLMNLYLTFKGHQWKYVFLTNESMRYKFQRRIKDSEAVIGFANDWLQSSDTIPELKVKWQKHSSLPELSHALLCYMTFVTSDKHEVSNYRPSINDFE
jgi:hypothetical protein